MSKVTLGALGGISNTIGQVTLPAGNTLTVEGDIYHHHNTGAMKVPTGTTAQRPNSPAAGVVRFNTDENYLEVYTGSAWNSVIGPDAAATSNLGTQSNPGILIMIVMVVVGF